MKSAKSILALATALAFTTPAIAQDKAELDTTRTSYRIIMADIEDGKMDEFDEMVKKSNEIAALAGREPLTFMHMMSGRWDVMAIIPLTDGMATMDYKVAPSSPAWRAAAIKYYGSEEKMKEADEAMQALIKSTLVEYGHTHSAE